MTVNISKPSLNLREELAKINSSEADKALVDGALTVKSAKVYGAVTSDSLRVEGDVVFTDDTGLTPKFFWDASAESLGIGTSSPVGKLTISTDASFSNQLINLGSTEVGHVRDWSIGIANGSSGALRLFDLTANTTRLTIDSSGKVGIGTSSPARNLHIHSTGNTDLHLTNTTTGTGSADGGSVTMAGTTMILNNREVGDVRVYTQSTERMRIDSSGVMIWKSTSPQRVPAVNTTEMMGDGTVGQTLRFNTSHASPRGAVQFFYNGGFVGGISQSTTSTVYATSSDYRLKTNVLPMTGATATFKQLKPVNFEWIADGTRVDGFLAHELGEVIPAAATGSKDAMRDEEYTVTEAVEATYDEEGTEVTAAVEAVMATRSVPDMQGIDQSKIVPLLTAALQEAIAKIESLETRLTALEAV